MLFDAVTLANDVIQATIVIFGTSVVLYNLKYSVHDRVVRSFSAVVIFVVLVYFADLMITRTDIPISAEPWLRAEWIGISFVPSALFHLADALLVTSGSRSRRRKWLVRLSYLVSIGVLALVALTDLIAGALVDIPRAPHLQGGPLFPLFAAFYWFMTVSAFYTVLRAYRRSITTATRARMRRIVVAFLAAPIGVFPYLIVNVNPNLNLANSFWLLIAFGNLIVGAMFAVLTANLVYFGTRSPDRVVRVRLYKFMARVPMTGTIVLLVYVLVSRAGSFLGLPTETALAIAVVATVMLVQWAIHSYKGWLERFFQLNQEPDVRRIQQLGDRLLTSHDLQQFLEIILTATCEALRVPTAFVAATTGETPAVEAIIGPYDFDQENGMLSQSHLRGLPPLEELVRQNGLIMWQNYWIKPLYNRSDDVMLGIFGFSARGNAVDLNQEEQVILDRLSQQAAEALEDRLLQQGVFAAVEGILPEITALQRRRSAATYGTDALLRANGADDESALLASPEFDAMVRDALKHIWGGPKLAESPLLDLAVVQGSVEEHDGNPAKALQAVLRRAIEQQKPEGERSLTRTEWLLYNILEQKFVQGKKVRDIARRLAMSQSDLYRKQRVAIENVARAVRDMESDRLNQSPEPLQRDDRVTAGF
jgi:hypothetical protein